MIRWPGGICSRAPLRRRGGGARRRVRLRRARGRSSRRGSSRRASRRSRFDDPAARRRRRRRCRTTCGRSARCSRRRCPRTACCRPSNRRDPALSQGAAAARAAARPPSIIALVAAAYRERRRARLRLPALPARRRARAVRRRVVRRHGADLARLGHARPGAERRLSRPPLQPEVGGELQHARHGARSARPAGETRGRPTSTRSRSTRAPPSRSTTSVTSSSTRATAPPRRGSASARSPSTPTSRPRATIWRWSQARSGDIAGAEQRLRAPARSDAASLYNVGILRLTEGPLRRSRSGVRPGRGSAAFA